MATSSSLLGPAAAVGASVTWAYGSTRYAHISRQIGSARVNFARAVTVLPIFFVVGAVLPMLRGQPVLAGAHAANVAWLAAAVLCSYALGDSIFFTAARRIGITTALAIASSYPLWAALWGATVSDEPFGVTRSVGTMLCVAGVIWLVRLARPAGGTLAADGGASARARTTGLLLAFGTSFLWAANSVSVKHGAVGLDVWQANLIHKTIASVLLFPQIVVGPARKLPASPAEGWLPMMPVFLLEACAGSLFYVYGLAHTDLAVGATLSSLAPLVSVPFALAVGEERWSLPRFAAVLVTVGGVVVLLSGGTPSP